MIHVEFYDLARARAGVDRADVEGATLGDVLTALAQRYPALVPDVLTPSGLAPHWRASLDGGKFLTDPLTPLRDGDVIVLLTALAGG